MSDKINGAEALIRALIDEGADTVFGYPGGSIMPVYDRLYDYTDRLRHILARHEQGAIHAAQGYARASGRVGVVIATSGPGATNLITGLSDAMMDSTPLVVVTGQVQSALLGKDAFQETDVVGITQPITKWAVQIRRPEDVAPAVARAFYIAANGRPGPVVLDIAKDAQTAMCEYRFSKCNFIRSYDPDPMPDDEKIAVAADLLNASQRPMILSGHGVMISGAERELLELAEKADIPVATTMLGLSTIPTAHPLNKGMLGMHGNLGPNVNTNKADLILAVGMRFDDRVTGDVAKYAPQAKIVHIDIDASEFDKTVRTHTHLHGDAAKVLRKLIPLVNPAIRADWNATFGRHAAVEQERVKERELNPREPGGKMLMGEVVSRVSEAMGHDAILVTDVGQNQMFGVRYFSFVSPAASSPPAASARWASASPRPSAPRLPPRSARWCSSWATAACR